MLDITAVARDVVTGRALTSWQVLDDILPMVFMPLIGAPELPDDIGVLYALQEDRFPTTLGINGFPMFSAFRILNREQADELRAEIERMQEALGMA